MPGNNYQQFENPEGVDIPDTGASIKAPQPAQYGSTVSEGEGKKGVVCINGTG